MCFSSSQFSSLSCFSRWKRVKLNLRKMRFCLFSSWIGGVYWFCTLSCKWYRPSPFKSTLPNQVLRREIISMFPTLENHRLFISPPVVGQEERRSHSRKRMHFRLLYLSTLETLMPFTMTLKGSRDRTSSKKPSPFWTTWTKKGFPSTLPPSPHLFLHVFEPSP